MGALDAGDAQRTLERMAAISSADASAEAGA
jgi:hypothetical protein